jgi:predicted SAM-dependent methyltransferase
MNILECPVCNNKCNQGERYCGECGSVERHRALVNLYKKNIIGDLTSKNVLIVSEGKRDNGKYYETSYYFSKISVLTTLDIMDHTTYFKDTQRFDIYNRLENLKSINDNSFDCIICNHVLTAVEYDLTALTEISRVLKKNGIFVMNDGISHPITESYIAKIGQFTRRHYCKNDIMKILLNYFGDVSLNNAYDNIFKDNCAFLICKDNNKNIKMGVSVPLPDEGWWKHIVVVFSLSRCGSSSLEIALQNIGYQTVYVDKGRAIRDSKIEEYEQILLNIKQKKSIFENINKKFNAFILGSILSTDITKIIQDYPGIKIISTERDNDSWVISMKNHQLVADRPNPKRKDLIDSKNKFIKSIKTQIEQNKFSDNFLLFNTCNGDGYDKLCNFLHKDIPKSNYPHISTNNKLKLTQEQIDF